MLLIILVLGIISVGIVGGYDVSQPCTNISFKSIYMFLYDAMDCYDQMVDKKVK